MARTAALAAVLAGALGAALLAGCADGDVRRAPAASGTPEPSTAVATATAAPAASGTPAPSTTGRPAASRRTLALYWLGATGEPRGPRLYREFASLPVSGDPVRAAVAAVLEREPADPDYTSLWADGTTVRDVRREGTTAVVDLSAQARTNGGGSAFEAMTVQQLVHTVTAADPSVQAVRLLVEGRAVETLWGSAATGEPVRRAPAAEVLGPVWLDVAEGAVVDGSFGGTATVFEATVSWQVRAGSRVVQEGFSTASEGAPGRGTWTAELDVPPGDYELRAYESSARDGSVTWLDTKRVRVS